MKNCFRLLLLAVAVLQAAAFARADTLSKEERDRAISYLQETRDEFIKDINSLSDAQWAFKPSPERWSIAECAEHIAVAEDTVWQVVQDQVLKSPAAPESKPEVAGKDEIIQKMVPDRSKKVQAPERLQPTGRWATRAELIKHFTERRAEEIAYLRETQDDLRSHFAEHPFMKLLDGYQWLLLNGAHSKRHTAQIEEVKTDANYPKS